MSSRSDRVRIIEQAEKYVRAGRVKDAIAEYEKLTVTDTQDVGTLNIIGDLYLRLNQRERALRAFLKVAEEYERRGLVSQALAIFKKIHKLYPESAEYALKLGDLYAQQGFLADAKSVYGAIVERLAGAGHLAEATAVAEKVVQLSRDDIESRRSLAGLYQAAGNIEGTIALLNEIADILTGRGDLEAAVGVLEEALTLRPGDTKSLISLVEVHKKQGRLDRAIEVLETNLERSPDDVQLLNLLGNIHFEAGDHKKAEDIFTRIVTGHPLNVNARIKLGRIQILKDKLDQAYELFEPLINNLVKKHREDKAIGLLGLILESQKPHLPALERLALIYRTTQETKKLEVVDRAILDELRKQGARDRMLAVYSELLMLRPDDVELAAEARAFRREMGLPDEEIEEEASHLSEEDRQAIEESMAQAELYMQQGLVRIARRLLENLRMRYPEEPQIQRKIAVLDEIRTHMDEEEIRKRVERTSLLEAQFRERAASKRTEDTKKVLGPFPEEVLQGEKVSTAEIFAETDIVPFVPSEPRERHYKDLRPVAEMEIRLIEAARQRQARSDTLRLERELSTIVSEFKSDLKTKLRPEEGETHYQLGLAFMGQGLLEEAVEELLQASRDRKVAIEAFSALAACARQKGDLREAERWLSKALLGVKEGTDQYYAVLFELAEVYEALGERDKALARYREIQDWNRSYRDVSARLESLEG